MADVAHHELQLLNPVFSSPPANVLTEQEHLRRMEMRDTMPTAVFLQIKQVFHCLMR